MALNSFKLVILFSICVTLQSFLKSKTVASHYYSGHDFPSDIPFTRCPKPGPNWKQCIYASTNDNRNNGEVHECLFYKERPDTYLRVVYQGNLRVACKNHCCKRWFFTFNKIECSTPASIDAVVYQDVGGGTGNIHRSASQEGYCGGIGRGIVRVGFSVGNCAGYGDTNAFTSWNSVSRIIIEEINPPQV